MTMIDIEKDILPAYIWFYVAVSPRLPDDDFDWVNVGAKTKMENDRVDLDAPIVVASVALEWIKNNLEFAEILRNPETWLPEVLRKFNYNDVVSFGVPTPDGFDITTTQPIDWLIKNIKSIDTKTIITGHHYRIKNGKYVKTVAFCKSN